MIGYPKEGCQKLLKVALAPEPAAKRGWAEWQQTGDLEAISWAELRLMGAVGRRLALIDPTYPERARIEGMGRFIWARNQCRLKEVSPALDLLAGLRVMLIKGGARHAMDSSALATRFVRDLDVYVHPEDLAECNERLLSEGFYPTSGKLPGYIRSSDFAKSGSNIELDVHAAILRHGRSTRHDELLWERAEKRAFHGREIFIPSATDQLLISLCHGMIADLESPADWALDAGALVPAVDWALLESECSRRSLHAPIGAALQFLREELQLSVPTWRRGSWLFRRELSGDAKPRKRRTLLDRSAAFAAERVRAIGCRREKGAPSMRHLGRPTWSGQGLRVFPCSQWVEPGSLELVIESTQSARFDCWLEGRWIARLRIRPVFGVSRWRFTLPILTAGTLRIEQD